MTKAGKWILGCGIGCLLLVAIPVVVLVGGSAWLAYKSTEPFERAAEKRQVLAERFGENEAYTPPAELIRAERLEVFLAVRERLRNARTTLAGRFEALALTPRTAREMEERGVGENLGTAWNMTKSSFALAPDSAALFEARNEALLSEGMGLGEYTWLYALSYWAALAHPAQATLADAEQFSDAPAPERPMAFALFGTIAMTRIRADLRSMLRRTLAALPADGSDGRRREQLSDELRRLESDPDRVPWQDGIPPELVEVFGPYRERLESNWNAATNPLELAINRKKRFMSYRLE
jgi:hypothetical protein